MRFPTPLPAIQNVVYFARIDVLGQSTREKVLDLLKSLYEQGKPVPSRIIAQRLTVSKTRIGHILGDAKRAGLARPIFGQGWEPTERVCGNV